jgi:3-oxoacyl-[acyl-carrier protein] reductase
MRTSVIHSGRTYFVLGATGGIAAALCRRLKAEGARLFLSARNEVKLRELAGELEAGSFAADATVPEQVDAAVQAASNSGSLNGAVNCTGSLLLKPAHLTTNGEWRQTIAQSLDSCFYLLRSVVRHLAGGSSVVFVSSAAARVGLANHEAIAAAKAGILGLALSAAATYASRGIRVNCVAPGLVETPLTEKITSREASRKASEAMHALGRIGRPDEIAAAISWFLSPEQDWVTGQVLGVDGGLATVRAR